MKTILYLFILLFIYNYSAAQEYWVGEKNGTSGGDDEFTAITVSGDSVYVTGNVTNTSTGIDIFTAKYHKITGEILWTKTYNGPGNGTDMSNSITISDSGFVYITGKTYVSTNNGYDFVTIKYNGYSGDIIWTATYHSDAPLSSFYQLDDEGKDIAVNSNGDVFVTGYSGSEPINPPDPEPDYMTIKYFSNGNMDWSERYDNGNIDIAYSIDIDDSSHVYVTGGSYSSKTDEALDAVTIRYDADSVQRWVHRHNDGFLIQPYEIGKEIRVEGAYVYITGSTGVIDEEDYLTIKFNKFNGNTPVWIAIYSHPSLSFNYTDRANGIDVDSDGNVYVTGESTLDGTPADFDYVTVKYNSAGAQQWAERFAGWQNGRDIAYDIKVEETEEAANVYVTGTSNQGNSTNLDDIVTIKYNGSDGDSIWVHNFNRCDGDDWGAALDIDGSGGVFVCGESNGAGNWNGVLFSINSQVLDNNSVLEWAKIYNGAGSSSVDVAYDITTDADSGNVYVTGTTKENGTDGTDITTIKYSPSGTQLWKNVVNDSSYNGHDSAYSIVVKGDYVYITGMLYTSNDYDCVTIKYDKRTGEELWVRRYNNSAVNLQDKGYALAVNDNGDVFVTGYSEQARSTPGNYAPDYLTIKYNSSGTEQWVKKYEGPVPNNQDVAYDIELDGSGYVYVTGKSYDNGTIYTSAATIKYDPANGDSLWVRRWDGSNTYDNGKCIVIVGSYLYIGGHSNDDYLLLKYSTSGTFRWSVTYNGEEGELDELMAIGAHNQNIYVTGYSLGSVHADNYDYLTIMFDSSGSVVWDELYDDGVNKQDFARDLKIDSDGNCYVTGRSNQNIPTIDDIITIKYDNAGSMQWIQKYDRCNANDWGFGIALDPSCNVLVAGTSGNDWATLKYSNACGLDDSFTLMEGNNSPSSYSLSQNYPNPFNPVTNINYELPVNGIVSIVVFDILGREVARLVSNEFREAGKYTAQFNGNRLSSGVYFYRLKSGSFIQTRRMVLLK